LGAILSRHRVEVRDCQWALDRDCPKATAVTELQVSMARLDVTEQSRVPLPPDALRKAVHRLVPLA